MINCSIAAVAGGKDRYKVYLNDKLLLTDSDFEKVSSALKTVQLSKANYNDLILVYYSHCGTPAKERQIVLKDDKGKVYLEWQFSGNSSVDPMKIPVKDIWDKVYNAKHSKLALHYYSNQLSSNGRMLTPVVLGNTIAGIDKKGQAFPATAAGLAMLASAGGLLWYRKRTRQETD